MPRARLPVVGHTDLGTPLVLRPRSSLSRARACLVQLD